MGCLDGLARLENFYTASFGSKGNP